MVCKKETGVRFSMTEIFTNRVGIVRLILVNGLPLISSPESQEGSRTFDKVSV